MRGAHRQYTNRFSEFSRLSIRTPRWWDSLSKPELISVLRRHRARRDHRGAGLHLGAGRNCWPAGPRHWNPAGAGRQRAPDSSRQHQPPLSASPEEPHASLAGRTAKRSDDADTGRAEARQAARPCCPPPPPVCPCAHAHFCMAASLIRGRLQSRHPGYRDGRERRRLCRGPSRIGAGAGGPHCSTVAADDDGSAAAALLLVHAAC